MSTEYLNEYKEFMSSFQKGVTTGEDVGILIARMAQYYADANFRFASTMVTYNKVAAEISNSTEESGKPLTVAKANTMAEATIQFENYLNEKVNIANIEQIINALKALQKGILNEYSHMSGI